MNNENKLLLITGASKGIGRATAEHFSSQGYRVINLSRSNCEVESVVNIKTDLAKQDGLESIKEQLLNEIGEPQQIALVHNAAVLTKDSVDSIDPAILRQVLNLNVVAAATLNTVVIPLMKENSSIIYISSTLGTKAVANTYAYSISKHAVIGQMRASCQDLVGSGIHTACICPGFTDTEMLNDHLGNDPEILAQIAQGVALKRLAQPSEIAESIWFCSQNPVINGSVLHANLGQIEH